MLLSRSACSFVLFAVVACAGKTTTPTPPAGPTADQACTDTAKAACAKFASCEPAGIALRYADEATCEARQKTRCLSSLSAAGTGATSSTVEACVAVYPTWACADFENGVQPTACQPQKGTGADGSSCEFPAQCQSAWCSVPKGAACGTCAALPKAGDSCASGASCGPGMACTADTQVCAPIVTAAGGACDTDDVCGFGLGCVGAAGTTKGTCQPLGTNLDAVCDSKAATAPRCARYTGFVCLSGKCAKASLVPGGQPCGLLDATSYAYCSGAADCVIPAGGKGKGTCLASAADGAVCDSSAGPFCMAPARCVGTASEAGVSGTCQMPSATCK